ncbi:hypothetical protein HPB48_021403 [Haemaphysalis longicornis]|uniref:Transposable element P transposase n=1 Tax=Haemaphysalis longicornis TaxID=44386 RepID=A0A9J6FXC4_HAELO|nr:hypothetical protein HPB48_021403 [Haemaphysalis longicornis]
MVHSLMNKFKEVVHIVPVHKPNSEFLHKLLREVICGLEKIGFKVICVVTDNNEINRKAMLPFKPTVVPAIPASSPKSPENDFVFPHPCDAQRPLFFLIDPVHILKCVRNNWLKTNDQCFWFPAFKPDETGQRQMLYAYFKTIKAAYELECDQLLRYGYTVSRKAVSPSDIEKQNVQLALQVFSESGPNALRAIGAKHQLKHYEETASFMETIVKWWKIANVKTPFKGARFRDDFKKPVFPSERDPKLSFVYDFLDWLEYWKEKQADTCKLTKETHGDLHQTT